MENIKQDIAKALEGKKIIKCPKCKKEIQSLNNYQSGENYYQLAIINGESYYETEGFQEDNKVNDYECPECNEVLFTDEEDAIKFLKTGKCKQK